MLIKAGVDISRLSRPTRKALEPCNSFCLSIGIELIITSTYEGTHSPGSLHFANRAFDIRLPERLLTNFVPDLRKLLGPNFDVVQEADHVHIEYDPE